MLYTLNPHVTILLELNEHIVHLILYPEENRHSVTKGVFFAHYAPLFDPLSIAVRRCSTRYQLLC